jgi:hypothetical protein
LLGPTNETAKEIIARERGRTPDEAAADSSRRMDAAHQ